MTKDILTDSVKKNDSLELYIHIPFCVRKCNYCDFLSFPAEEAAADLYFAALGREIGDAGKCLRYASEAAGKELKKDAGMRVTSVFIGGGTPSLPGGERIAALLDRVRSAFSVAEDAEISIEINPGTADAEKMRQYMQAGVTRMSIGCQSFSETELRTLGRIHGRQDIYGCVEAARAAGCENLNLDLISALPGQPLKAWEKNLREAAALEPEHISAYSLIIEEGTPFGRMRDRLELPDEETERAMYLLTDEVLSSFGFRQYEISNYAKDGCACRHNVGYWTGIPYFGLGLGAASYIPGAGAAVRFSNPSGLDAYVRMFPEDSTLRGEWASLSREQTEMLGEEDLQAEFMILGLRMNRGVSAREFTDRFGISVYERYGPVIERHAANGLLKTEDGRIALTGEGMLLANLVMADFL